MEKVEIKKLIEQCLNYFYESGYAKGTIDYYKCLWTKGILQYMSDKGIDMYSKYPLIPTLWMIFEDSTFAFRSGDKHRSRRIYGK